MEEKISEILKLCYKITNTTKHTAFFNYSGHVNLLDVHIHIGGWSEKVGSRNKKPILEYYIDKYDNNATKALDKTITKLKKYLKESN